MTTSKDFVHLHLHTGYSLLHGMINIDELCDRVAALGMNAVAITDTNTLAGAVEFCRAAKKSKHQADHWQLNHISAKYWQYTNSSPHPAVQG